KSSPEIREEQLPPGLTGPDLSRTHAVKLNAQPKTAMSSEPAESTEFWNGFMPTNLPITRLPSEWESWEAVFEAAMNEGLQLGNRLGITEEEKQRSERWRLRARELPVLAASQDLKHIRRARLILVWILHFYVHTLRPQSDSEP
ncbi:indoleamine 2, 3-dioxyganeseb, partial [Moniliophthora roreri]